MKKIAFITEGQPKAGEMIIYRNNYIFGDGIALEAWDDQEPYAMITQDLPDISLKENEIVLHHDVINTNGFDGRDFLSDFLEYMADGSREITFGPFNTKTLVVKLKDNWKELCASGMEV